MRRPSQQRAVRDSFGGDVSAPDNLVRNEKNMHGNTVTPMDQGNSEADLYRFPRETNHARWKRLRESLFDNFEPI